MSLNRPFDGAIVEVAQQRQYFVEATRSGGCSASMTLGSPRMCN
jgi:hypothetical protein